MMKKVTSLFKNVFLTSMTNLHKKLICANKMYVAQQTALIRMLTS